MFWESGCDAEKSYAQIMESLLNSLSLLDFITGSHLHQKSISLKKFKIFYIKNSIACIFLCHEIKESLSNSKTLPKTESIEFY